MNGVITGHVPQQKGLSPVLEIGTLTSYATPLIE
jgi:hypothetical protein